MNKPVAIAVALVVTAGAAIPVGLHMKKVREETERVRQETVAQKIVSDFQQGVVDRDKKRQAELAEESRKAQRAVDRANLDK